MVAPAAARILILVENLSVPFDRRVWQEAQALRDAGHEVHVICPRGSSYDVEPHARIEGVDIHRYPLQQATGVLGYVREYAQALWHSFRISRRLAAERPFDVVHACNPPDLLFLCALPHKRRGARFVFDHHDLVPELALSRFRGRTRTLVHAVCLALERLTFRAADLVIATNESYRRVAIERGSVPEDRVVVVRSGPDLGRFAPADPQPELKRGKRHLVCYLGVMGPQDGIDHALRALALLRSDHRRADFHAALIGDGTEAAVMRRLADELGLADVVEFTGRIPDDGVRAYLATADVCLAPDPKNPLNDVSTMNKIVEYMAMGRPIVSFDLVEARVSADGAALYARANDDRDFAAKIDELLNDEERREAMGSIGRARVEGALSWQHSADALVAAYRSLLGTRAAVRRATRATSATR